jgi:hypothetical protein
MTRTLDLRPDAIAEAERLATSRCHPSDQPLPGRQPLFLAIRTEPASELDVFQGLIFFFLVRIVDGLGRLLEDVFLPVRVPVGISATRMRSRGLERHVQMLVAHHYREAEAGATTAAAVRASAIQRSHRDWLSACEARDRWIVAMLDRTRRDMQRDLFNRRSCEPDSLHAHGSITSVIEQRLKASSDGSAGISVSTRPPVLVLVLLVVGGRVN